MSRSLEPTILSLIPTYNQALPTQLLELASSLLAQSKHRASVLKAEEEVARLYACANLACERLKIQLDLPPIEVRPPIPPRIYKRLYVHLDKVLAAPATPGRATFGRATASRDPSNSPSSRARHFRATPTKEAALAPFRNTPKGKVKTPSKLSHVITPAKASGTLPPWIRPTLRYLCEKLTSVKLGPTLAAGVESIVVPMGTRTSDEWVNSHLSWLIGALYLFVWKIVYMPDDMDDARYAKVRKDIVRTLREARKSITVKGLDEDETWEGWRDLAKEDLDAAANEINRRGWLESDWANGIDDIIISTEHTKDQRTPKAGLDDDFAEPNGQPRNRNGDTMFQERYDYLSENKQRDYAKWKEGMLRKIAALERRSVDAMEIC